MSVYVFIERDYEDEEIVGVFDSLEKARAEPIPSEWVWYGTGDHVFWSALYKAGTVGDIAPSFVIERCEVQ